MPNFMFFLTEEVKKGLLNLEIRSIRSTSRWTLLTNSSYLFKIN